MHLEIETNDYLLLVGSVKKATSLITELYSVGGILNVRWVTNIETRAS